MSRKQVGDTINNVSLETISGASLAIPPTEGVVHLQFRRYSGCPICNLHLRSFVQRHGELVSRAVTEVVVFASNTETMLKHHAEVPFAMVADPEKTLYQTFGVEQSATAILHPIAFFSAMKGTMLTGSKSRSRLESARGLPAEFLIDSGGGILSCNYGRHAADQWSVDEVLKKVSG
ncbi:MAG: peroxiredoxin-like family protein [Planctomycetota bacterium]